MRDQEKENLVINAFDQHGQSTAIELADKFGFNFKYCQYCETETPIQESNFDVNCLICGQ